MALGASGTSRVRRGLRREKQQARSESGPSGSSQSRRVTPIAFGKDLSSVTALSTPPLIATAMRPEERGARNTGPIALASASTASVSPPTAAASSSVNPTSERSSPEASASTMRSPSNRRRTRAKSAAREESPMSSSIEIRLAAIAASAGFAGARPPPLSRPGSHHGPAQPGRTSRRWPGPVVSCARCEPG